MSTIEVKVPDIGDFKDVPIIEVFVKPGDAVKAEDSLVTLESDKATMDVPAPAAGTVKDLRVKLGQPQRSASTPQSCARSSAAAITSRRIVPEPSNCTRGAFALPAAALSRYIPLMMFGAAPSGIAG